MSKKRDEDKCELLRIKELEAENKRLCDELYGLKRELAQISGKKSFRSSSDSVQLSFKKSYDNVRLFSKKRYTAYLAAIISNTSVFRLYERIISVVKKYTLITASLKIAASILAFLQTSAVFVVALSLFLVTLPFTFIFGYLAFILSLFGRKKKIAKIKELTKSKRVTVFFAHKGADISDGSFFARNVCDVGKRDGGITVIVSPYLLSGKGIAAKRRFYSLMRLEKEDVIIVRRHFFFTLNKRIFKGSNKDITIVY